MMPAEFPGKGRSTDLGVLRIKEELITPGKKDSFYLYPWIIMEGWEVEEGK